MTHTKTGIAIAGAAASLLLVSGCSTSQPEAATTSPTAAPSATASPSPTQTQSAREKKIAKGEEAIRDFAQTGVDIYAAVDPNIDDMHEVATGKALENSLKDIQQGLIDGWTTTEGTVEVKWVKPVSVGGKKMVLYACVDRSDIKGGLAGEAKEAYDSVAVDYWVEKVESRWKVSRTVLHDGQTKPKPC